MTAVSGFFKWWAGAIKANDQKLISSSSRIIHKISYTCLIQLLFFMALISGGCVATTSSPVLWHEAEEYSQVSDSIGQIVAEKAPASMGTCLTGGVLGEKGRRLVFSVDLKQDIPDAKMVFRYARFHWRSDMTPSEIICTVENGDEITTKRMVFNDTGGWGTSGPDEWSLNEIELGDLAKGVVKVILVSDSETSDVVLDGFFIAPKDVVVAGNEFASLSRVKITGDGYVGIEMPTSAVDPSAFEGFNVVTRGFADNAKQVTVTLERAGTEPVAYFARQASLLSTTEPARLAVTSEQVENVPDGNYTLAVTWDGGKEALCMPFTVLGRLLVECEQQAATMREQLRGWTDEYPVSIHDDLEYLIQYAEHVVCLLRDRAGQEVSEEALQAAKKYFSPNGQYKRTTTEQFADTLRHLIRQHRAMTANMERGWPAYEGLTGVLRRAFYSETAGTLEEYQFYLPALYGQGGKCPLLIRLAGNEDMFQDEDSRLFVDLLEKRGYVAVAPRANNGYFGEGQNDLVQLIRLMLEEYPEIDPRRVYCTGASAGGFGSYKLAVDHPELIAGIACVNGAIWKEYREKFDGLPFGIQETPNLKGLKVMLIQGDLDRLVDKFHTDFLAAELKRLGIAHQYKIMRGRGHHIPTADYMEKVLEYFD